MTGLFGRMLYFVIHSYEKSLRTSQGYQKAVEKSRAEASRRLLHGLKNGRHTSIQFRYLKLEAYARKHSLERWFRSMFRIFRRLGWIEDTTNVY